jgi:hypothetical protein
VQIDAGVQVGDHGHDVGGELVSDVVRGDEVFRVARAILAQRDLQRAPRQQGEDLVRAVSGRDDERARREVPVVGADPNQAVAGLDPDRRGAFVDGRLGLCEAGEQRPCHRREVDESGLGVEIRNVGLQIGKAFPHRGVVEGLHGQSQAVQNLGAHPRIGGVQCGGHRRLGDVHAAAAHQDLHAGGRLELVPQPHRLVRQAGVGGVQIVTAIGAGSPEGRGRGVADVPALQDGDPGPVQCGLVGGEQTHHASTDHEQVEDFLSHTHLPWP